MKSIFKLSHLSLLVLLLFQCNTTTYPSDHYVDKNASGQNNGTSWDNAWQSFSAINWGSISPGDYIFISGRDTGGANDSTVYYETLTPQCQGTEANRITIIAGKYSPSPSGHSGRVIIDGEGVRDINIFFDDYGAGSPRYITIKGFECRNAAGGIAFNIDDSTEPLCVGVIIDSCYIYDFHYNAGIGVMGNTDRLTVRNCVIITPLIWAGQTDCFYFGGVGDIYPRESKIHDNIILNKNQDPVAHNDAIQSVEADGFQFYRNIIINDSVNSQQGGGLPFILSSIDNHYNESIENRHPVILYDNFCYMGGAWWATGAASGFTMWTRYYSDENHQPITLIFNNTIVTNGPQVGGVGQQYKIDLFINNINAMWCLPDGVGGNDWRTGAAPSWWTNFYAGSGWQTYMPMDSVRNNLFWKEDNWQSLFSGGWVYSTGGTGSISGWSSWLSHGGTGVNADPLFVNHFGHEPDQSVLVPDLKSGSPAIDAGEDIQPLLDWIHTTWGNWYDIPNTDIYGNPIVGNRDIGAFEYK